MAMASTLQGVFVDTNLGTRLAIDVSRDITARDFKREFEREHFKCFSKSGEIQVSALMVERKSCLYHLADSMTIKSVFQKVDGTWFLHAEVRALSDCSRPCLHNYLASNVVDHVFEGSDVSHPSNPENFVMSTAKSITKGNCKRWRGKRIRRQQPLLGKLGKLFYFAKKRKRRKNIHLPAEVDQTGMEIVGVDDTAVPTHIDENKTALNDCASSKEVEPAEEMASILRRDELTVTSSEAVVSVSGIINKYFLNLSEDGGDVSPTTSVTSRVHSSSKQHLKTKVGDICSSRQVTPSASRSSTKFSAKNLLPRPSPSPTNFGGRRYKHDKPEVGKRLVMASYSLGISPKKNNLNVEPSSELVTSFGLFVWTIILQMY
ncbi:uncharacterized protein LOC112193464 isoform X1 [Rosa chinensis]|uniref:uncharacterized protein LOC112193464 isoform X1 n=1 Tax=Rosa chinensis TaxID=74649 RepID=UPI001AD94581|nr:uncharacterized protein LOC112193464 isoform X1 [Rosa chinensis]